MNDSTYKIVLVDEVIMVMEKICNIDESIIIFIFEPVFYNHFSLNFLVFLFLSLRLSLLFWAAFGHFDVLQVGLGIFPQLLQLIAIHLQLPLSVFVFFLQLLSLRLLNRLDW